jgi:hypothetical protein
LLIEKPDGICAYRKGQGGLAFEMNRESEQGLGKQGG